MVKFFSSIVVILSMAIVSIQQTTTPVIGGACKLGAADVQIGGKQTQFFLKCESTPETGEGQGLWVVKSRSAPPSASPTKPPSIVTEEVSAKIDTPKKLSTLAQPTICEQDSSAKPGDKCNAPVTCLQVYYPERNSFLQCDETSKIWIKKFCKNLLATFSFEHQACIGADKPNVAQNNNNTNDSRDILLRKLPIHVCPSKKRCSYPLNTCDHGEACDKINMCCHLVTCPYTNELPLDEPDYCTSIYQCPSNSDCVSGRCCKKNSTNVIEVSHELFIKPKIKHNVKGRFYDDREFLKKYNCVIDPLAADKCSLDEPCPDDSICIDGKCCLRPVTSICDNGLYSLTIPLSCNKDNDCGTTAVCEKERCCPLELKEFEKKGNGMPGIEPVIEDFEKLLKTTTENLIKMNETTIQTLVTKTEESPLLNNLPIYPISPKSLTPLERYKLRLCPNGHESLSTPSNCLSNEDCPSFYQCTVNLCCSNDMNETTNEKFDKEYNEEIMGKNPEIYNLKNISMLTNEEYKKLNEESKELLKEFNKNETNMIQLPEEQSTQIIRSDKFEEDDIILSTNLIKMNGQRRQKDDDDF
uniref:WAP domain-containing protein n=1 Tax=Parastrongyloides trichosuri TaxID=131310 RepID=A0A0N5A4U3_PARTI